MSKDLSLSQLAEVLVVFESRKHTSDRYVIPKEDIDAFFEATIKLHYSPGVNPHSGGTTSKIASITAWTMELDPEVYWWASPELEADCSGARLVRAKSVIKSWTSPEEQARNDAERREENDC